MGLRMNYFLSQVSAESSLPLKVLEGSEVDAWQ